MKDIIEFLNYLKDNSALFPLLLVLVAIGFIAYLIIKNQGKFINTIKKMNKRIEFQEGLEGVLNDQNEQINTLKNDVLEIRNSLKSYDDTISELVNIIQSKTEKDNEIIHKFDKLEKMLEKQETLSKERTVSIIRRSLWKMHGELMETGYTTPDSLRTWNELGKAYTSAGGNDIYHDKLNPEVQALPFLSELPVNKKSS